MLLLKTIRTYRGTVHESRTNLLERPIIVVLSLLAILFLAYGHGHQAIAQDGKNTTNSNIQQTNTMTIALKNGENISDSSIISYKIADIQTTIPELASGKYRAEPGFESISATGTSVWGSFTINVSTENATSITTKPNTISISLHIEDIQKDKTTGETTYNLKSDSLGMYSQITGHQISGGKLTTDGKEGQLVITVS